MKRLILPLGCMGLGVLWMLQGNDAAAGVWLTCGILICEIRMRHDRDR